MSESPQTELKIPDYFKRWKEKDGVKEAKINRFQAIPGQFYHISRHLNRKLFIRGKSVIFQEDILKIMLAGCDFKVEERVGGADSTDEVLREILVKCLREDTKSKDRKALESLILSFLK